MGTGVGLYFGMVLVPNFEEKITVPFESRLDVEKRIEIQNELRKSFQVNPNATYIDHTNVSDLKEICDDNFLDTKGIYCLNEKPRYLDIDRITIKNATKFLTYTDFNEYTFNSTEFVSIFDFIDNCNEQKGDIIFSIKESTMMTSEIGCVPTAETVALNKQEKFQEETLERLDRILEIMESETTLNKCLDGVCTYSIYINHEKFENAGISSVVMTQPSKVSSKFPDKIYKDMSEKYKRVCEDNNGTYYILALTEFCILDNRRFMEISHG